MNKSVAVVVSEAEGGALVEALGEFKGQYRRVVTYKDASDPIARKRVLRAAHKVFASALAHALGVPMAADDPRQSKLFDIGDVPTTSQAAQIR